MNRRRSTDATSDQSRCVPSSAALYRFGYSRRTDHAVTMPVREALVCSAKDRGVALARWQLLLFRSFATNGLDATSTPQGQTDTLALVCWIIASFSASSSTSETQTLSLVDEADIMDLTTLVTACALAVDPKIMHALIWHQSGGEPWSFTVAGVHQPQVFRDVSDAVDAAHDTYPADVTIRIGLTGLSATPRSVAPAMFAPCSNITVAARQITQLAERCKTSTHFNGNPIYCAIAAYRGSWERPDNAFVD